MSATVGHSLHQFGDWRGQIFKIRFGPRPWRPSPKSRTSRRSANDGGVGLIEPPYKSRRYRYSPLSINVTTNGRMTVISETEAKWKVGAGFFEGADARTHRQGCSGQYQGAHHFQPARPGTVSAFAA